MLSKEQSEVVAEALLSPARDAQSAAHQRAQARRLRRRIERRSRRRAAWFGLAGLVIAAAIGYQLSGHIFPTGLLGMGLGWAIGHVVNRFVLKSPPQRDAT